MVRIDTVNDLANLSSIPRPSREIELLSRNLLKLRQRISIRKDPSAHLLNLSIKVEQTPKNERNPSILKSSLHGDLKSIANMLPWDKFMAYQVNAWKFISGRLNGSEDNDIIVDAPTAFGKTEAVIPAVLWDALQKDGLVLIISPRRPLILDQINRIVQYNLVNNTLKLGLQISGIKPKLEWTIYDPDMHNVKINGRQTDTPIDYKRHFNYSFQTDLMTVTYKDPISDTAELTFITCSCGGKFRTNVNIRNRRYTQGPRGEMAEFLGTDTWNCNKCSKKIDISLSRDTHSTLKPNILFTTLNSIDSLLSDPDTRNDFRERLSAVVFDEVHTYNSFLGSHAGAIVKELKNLRTNSKPMFAGLSATIDDASEFGRKLFANDVKEFKPEKMDINSIHGGETYFFLKSKNREIDGGNSYSLKTADFIQLMILLKSSYIINPERVLSFADSVDAVILLSNQVADAYNVKRLQDYRLTRLLNRTNGFLNYNCNGFSQNCFASCGVFNEGECWEILRNEKSVTSPLVITPLPVSSANLQADRVSSSDLIISTAELELGIDLQDVSHLVQYGSPFTIFNYIQRKGRAGRGIGEYPNFYFVLGEKSNDYLYFSLGSDLLNRPYRLPLQTDNHLINDLHHNIQILYDEIESRFNHEISGVNVGSNRYLYIFKSAWLTLIQEAEPIFRNFLDRRIQLDYSNLNGMNSNSNFNMFKMNNKTSAKKLERTVLNNMDQLLLDGLTPLQYLEKESNRLGYDIENSVLPNQDKIALKLSLTSAFDPVLRELQGFPTDDASRLQHQKDLLEFLNSMVQNYLGLPISNLAASTYEKVTRLANTRNLFDAQGEAMRLFYELRTLFELSKSFNATLNSEIIKYFLRAQYFFILAQNSSYTPQTTLSKLIPPVDLYNTTGTECLWYIHSPANLNGNESIDIRDAVYRYFPFRLVEVGLNGQKLINMPEIRNGGNNYIFETSSTIEGYNFVYGNETILFPRNIRMETIRLSDPTNNILEFCSNCLKFYDSDVSSCENCRAPLSRVRPYASPITVSEIALGNDLVFLAGNLQYSNNSTVTLKLTGIELSISNTYYDQDTNSYMPARRSSSNRQPRVVTASQPYGFQVRTEGIALLVGRNKTEDLLSNFRGNYPHRSSGFTEKNVLHSIAHLWVKTIASTTGVTPEEFVYEIDEANYKILIAEVREGGSGFISTFLEYFQRSPDRIVSDMRNLVGCTEYNKNFSTQLRRDVYQEVHNLIGQNSPISKRSDLISMVANDLGISEGEVTENFPYCYDGCDSCITLSTCEIGADEQIDVISRAVAEWYVNMVTPADNRIVL